VIVAVPGARVVQVTVDPVVQVITVRHAFVAASAAVHVPLLVAPAGVGRRTARGIFARDADGVLVDVVPVLVVHVPVVQVIGVVVVRDGSVPTAGPVAMCMILVCPMIDHGRVPSLELPRRQEC
jgi:hypothetical protein